MLSIISGPSDAVQQYVALVGVVRRVLRLGGRQGEVHRVVVVPGDGGGGADAASAGRAGARRAYTWGITAHF